QVEDLPRPVLPEGLDQAVLVVVVGGEPGGGGGQARHGGGRSPPGGTVLPEGLPGGLAKGRRAKYYLLCGRRLPVRRSWLRAGPTATLGSPIGPCRTVYERSVPWRRSTMPSWSAVATTG